jgi:hypothetical protein
VRRGSPARWPAAVDAGNAASGIVNDANRYAIETVGDPAYPFKLFCRIIAISLETMTIVRSLPPLDIRDVDQKDTEPTANAFSGS